MSGCIHVLGVKATYAILSLISAIAAFVAGKELYPRTIDRPVIVENVVKVPVEVKVEVPVIKEVVKEVPVKLTPEQSDAIIAYNLVQAASDRVTISTESDVLPTTDGKAHPEVSPSTKIWLGSSKIRVIISLTGRAPDCCDKDEIFSLIQGRLQQAGFECEMASSDFAAAMFQSSNALKVEVRMMEASQYAYCGVVATSFHQIAIGMNSQANPAIGPWKKLSITPVERDTLIRAGKTIAKGYIKENIDNQLVEVCSILAKELKK